MDESHLIAVPPSPRVYSLIQTGSGSKSESSATSFILILSSQVSDVTSTAADVAFAVLSTGKSTRRGRSIRTHPVFGNPRYCVQSSSQETFEFIFVVWKSFCRWILGDHCCSVLLLVSVSWFQEVSASRMIRAPCY